MELVQATGHQKKRCRLILKSSGPRGRFAWVFNILHVQGLEENTYRDFFLQNRLKLVQPGSKLLDLSYGVTFKPLSFSKVGIKKCMILHLGFFGF